MTFGIAGIGWITASGSGTGKNRSRFNPTSGIIPDYYFKSILDRRYQRIGRMDAYSKTGISAAALALKDAGLDRWIEKRNIGIIATTAYGCLATDIRYYDTVMQDIGAPSSPSLFAYTLPTSFLGDIAIHFGITGPGFVIHEDPPKGLTGLNLGFENLSANQAEKMLVGICDSGYPVSLKPGMQQTPYAVFFVMEKISEPCRANYGIVEVFDMEDVRVGGNKIKDLTELIRTCAGHPPITERLSSTGR